MTWKSNELLGAAQKLLDILNDTSDAALLAAGGLTVATPKTALETKKGDFSTKEHDQEEAAQTALDATTAMNGSGQNLYDTISTVVDAASGVAGKKTSLGKRLRAVRTQLNKSKRTSPGSGSGSGSGSSSNSGSGSDSGSGS